MNRTITAIAATAFAGLSACAPKPELNLPPKQDPLPEFTAAEEKNILATADFMRCVMDQGGATLLNSPWFDTMLEYCADSSDLSEDMLHDVFDKFQTEYGHNWADMVQELL